MSEARRGIKRIASNYGRLGSTLLIGLVLVKVQFMWVGPEGFGLLVAIGASVGLAAMLQDVMRQSMIRELGVVWHAAEADDATENDIAHFRRVYASSFILCALVAVLTAGVFFAFFSLLKHGIWPFHEIPPAFRTGGLWILACEGVSIAMLVLLTPAYNMYIVTERFFESNLYFTLKRLTYLVSAVVLFIVLGTDQVELSLKLYGVCAAGMSLCLLLFAVSRIMLLDARLRPKLRMADVGAFREVLGTFGWNSTVVTAMNLHERIGAWIMLGVFGLQGSAMFGLALRLVSYVRMCTLGMTFGLDAVSARIASTKMDDTLRSIARHSTRLHGYVAIPCALTIFILAEPILQTWVGSELQNEDADFLQHTVVLVRIMVIGLMSRAIADGWMKLLYGAGHIKRYAPLILAGGIANPLMAFLFIYNFPASNEADSGQIIWIENWTGPAWGFSLAFLVVHLLLLPAIAAPRFGTTWSRLLGLLGRPLVISIVASLVYLAIDFPPGEGEWPLLLAASVMFAAAYGILGLLFGLEAPERRRALRLLGQWLRRDTQAS